MMVSFAAGSQSHDTLCWMFAAPTTIWSASMGASVPLHMVMTFRGSCSSVLKPTSSAKIDGHLVTSPTPPSPTPLSRSLSGSSEGVLARGRIAASRKSEELSRERCRKGAGKQLQECVSYASPMRLLSNKCVSYASLMRLLCVYMIL